MVVETSVSERALLRRTRQLEVRVCGRVFINAYGYQQMAAKKVVKSLLDKGLMVPSGSGFSRTPLGDKALERNTP